MVIKWEKAMTDETSLTSQQEIRVKVLMIMNELTEILYVSLSKYMS